jgi:NADPH:quinone reductase
VGSLAVQLAKLWGASTVIGAASPAKHSQVLAHGADLAIDYTQPHWSEKVLEATNGKGASIILDPLGDDGRAENLKALAPFGRWAIFGLLSGGPVNLGAEAMGQLIGKNQSVHGFSLSGEGYDLGAGSNELYQLVSEGKLKVDSGPQWPLAEAANAHRALENRETTGKVILVP